MKFYVRETIRRNKDGDELVTVNISESMGQKVSYIIFVEKSVKSTNIYHKSSHCKYTRGTDVRKGVLL